MTTRHHSATLVDTMNCERLGAFVTLILELKLDADTMFEWQKHSQRMTSLPGYP